MKHTILLADDSVTIQKVVELTFLDEDVRVISVGNGSDALARLDEVRPDLILADVHMPGADGYEVCMTARRMLPGVPVLLLVGTFEIFDPERSSQAGASGHMKKPFDSQELLRRVRELLAAGRTATAPPPAPVSAESVAPELAFDPAAWEPAEAATAAPVAASDEAEGESWSFEPIADAAPAAQPAEPAVAEVSEVGEAGEGWNAFATSRFEAQLAELPDSFEPEPEPEPEPETEPEAEPEPVLVAAPIAVATRSAPSVAAATSDGIAASLSDADLERLARRVAELLSERAVRDVAWEVVPDLAEVLLKARIRELEAAVE